MVPGTVLLQENPTKPRSGTLASRASLAVSRGGPGPRRQEEYGDLMNSVERQCRQDVILGHQLNVTVSGDDRWDVAVDGLAIAKRFGEAYDAWAAGVAESYRQGRVPTARTSDE